VLDRTLMEALCGGVGEVAQICVLYPLETIKVRQSTGCYSTVGLSTGQHNPAPADNRAGRHRAGIGRGWLYPQA